MIEQVMDLRVDEATDLTTTERAELGRYEAVIKRGLETFVAVGNALLAIRRDRLYRATHATFEAYCQQRWQMTPDYANKLVGAAGVVGNLEAGNTIVLPTTESQARPLTRLEPEQQVEAWSNAVDDAQGKVPTAAQVTKAAAEFAPPKPPKPKLDVVICAPVWQLESAVTQWLASVSSETSVPSSDTILSNVKLQIDEPLKPGSWLDLLAKAVGSKLNFRQSDLIQAINNVGDHRRQARRQATSKAVYGAPAAEPKVEPAANASNYLPETERVEIDDPELRAAGFHLVKTGEQYRYWWVRVEGPVAGALRDTADIAIQDARVALHAHQPAPTIALYSSPEPDEFALMAAADDQLHTGWLEGAEYANAITYPDPRLGQAQLLRYMLVQVRNRARADYGELTGRHNDLLPWERDTELLIEPLDSLIEILSEKGQSK